MFGPKCSYLIFEVGKFRGFLGPATSRGDKKIKPKSFRQYSWHSEVEITWISFISCPHKTSMMSTYSVVTDTLQGKDIKLKINLINLKLIVQSQTYKGSNLSEFKNLSRWSLCHWWHCFLPRFCCGTRSKRKFGATFWF